MTAANSVLSPYYRVTRSTQCPVSPFQPDDFQGGHVTICLLPRNGAKVRLTSIRMPSMSGRGTYVFSKDDSDDLAGRRFPVPRCLAGSLQVDGEGEFSAYFLWEYE